MEIEILMSTMNRDNLDFLNPIFQFNKLDDFYITVVNQTTEDNWLQSNLANVKVINSLKRGSPSSRNDAIKNATKDICLMADDDIIYQPLLKKTILDSYKENSQAELISFEAINENGTPYTEYYKSGKHNKETLKKIYTWVISFKRKSFQEKNILFNYHFGVGSTFKGCTEYVFLRTAFRKNISMIHIDKTIVMHPNLSSGVLMGSNNGIFARSAMQQRFRGSWSYVWLLMYLIFLFKSNYISIDEIKSKWKIGVSGINKYKQLERAGKIDSMNDQ